MCLTIKLAKTKTEKQAAYHVRYKVFVEESRAVPMENPNSRHEKDQYDDFCKHIVAFDDGKPIGTVRLQTRTPRFIDNRNFLYGLAGEALFDYSHIFKKKVKLAEIARSSVLPAYRNGRIIMNLWKAVYLYCRKLDIDELITLAAPNIYTNSIEDAMLLYDVAAKKKCIHSEYDLKPKDPHFKISDQKIPLFSVEEKINPEKIKLPKNIKLYTRMGMSICGKPAIIPKFKKIAIPMIVSLSEAPRSIQLMFNQLNNEIILN